MTGSITDRQGDYNKETPSLITRGIMIKKLHHWSHTCPLPYGTTNAVAQHRTTRGPDLASLLCTGASQRNAGALLQACMPHTRQHALPQSDAAAGNVLFVRHKPCSSITTALQCPTEVVQVSTASAQLGAHLWRVLLRPCPAQRRRRNSGARMHLQRCSEKPWVFAAAGTAPAVAVAAAAAAYLAPPAAAAAAHRRWSQACTSRAWPRPRRRRRAHGRGWCWCTLLRAPCTPPLLGHSHPRTTGRQALADTDLKNPVELVGWSVELK